MEGHHQIFSRFALPFSKRNPWKIIMLTTLIFRISPIKTSFQQGTYPLAALLINKSDKQHDRLPFKKNESSWVWQRDIDKSTKTDERSKTSQHSLRGEWKWDISHVFYSRNLLLKSWAFKIVSLLWQLLTYFNHDIHHFVCWYSYIYSWWRIGSVIPQTMKTSLKFSYSVYTCQRSNFSADSSHWRSNCRSRRQLVESRRYNSLWDNFYFVGSHLQPSSFSVLKSRKFSFEQLFLVLWINSVLPWWWQEDLKLIWCFLNWCWQSKFLRKFYDLLFLDELSPFFWVDPQEGPHIFANAVKTLHWSSWATIFPGSHSDGWFSLWLIACIFAACLSSLWE